MEPTTVNSIIEYFEKSVAERKPLAPQLYLDGALKLNVLKGGEYDKMFELEQKVSLLESKYLEEGMTSARAKTFTKSSPLWLELQKQKARCKLIEDFILLAKKNATLISEQMRNNLE